MTTHDSTAVLDKDVLVETVPMPPPEPTFPGSEITHPAMSDDELLARLADTTLESFPHHEHVRAAWLFLQDRSPLEAIEVFAQTLRRFAAAKGAHGLYHETITWAFVLLINERMERHGGDLGWPTFCRLNPDLLSYRPSPLDRYYRPETLKSDLARRTFVLPDRGSEAEARG